MNEVTLHHMFFISNKTTHTYILLNHPQYIRYLRYEINIYYEKFTLFIGAWHKIEMRLLQGKMTTIFFAEYLLIIINNKSVKHKFRL